MTKQAFKCEIYLRNRQLEKDFHLVADDSCLISDRTTEIEAAALKKTFLLWLLRCDFYRNHTADIIRRFMWFTPPPANSLWICLSVWHQGLTALCRMSIFGLVVLFKLNQAPFVRPAALKRRRDLLRRRKAERTDRLPLSASLFLLLPAARCASITAIGFSCPIGFRDTNVGWTLLPKHLNPDKS